MVGLWKGLPKDTNWMKCHTECPFPVSAATGTSWSDSLMSIIYGPDLEVKFSRGLEVVVNHSSAFSVCPVWIWVPAPQTPRKHWPWLLLIVPPLRWTSAVGSRHCYQTVSPNLELTWETRLIRLLKDCLLVWELCCVPGSFPLPH